MGKCFLIIGNRLISCLGVTPYLSSAKSSRSLKKIFIISPNTFNIHEINLKKQKLNINILVMNLRAIEAKM